MVYTVRGLKSVDDDQFEVTLVTEDGDEEFVRVAAEKARRFPIGRKVIYETVLKPVRGEGPAKKRSR